MSQSTTTSAPAPAVIPVAPVNPTTTSAPITLDDLKRSLDELRKTPTAWKSFWQTYGPAILALGGVLLGILVNYGIQRRQLNDASDRFQETQKLERTKLVITILPSMPLEQQEVIRRQILHDYAPSVETKVTVSSEGSPHPRALLYQAFNQSNEFERSNEVLASLTQQDQMIFDRGVYDISRGGKTIGYAWAASTWGPVGFMKDDSGGWEMPHNLTPSQMQKVIARDQDTQLVVFAHGSPTGVRGFLTVSPEMPLPGTLVYLRSEQTKSGFFVTRYQGINGAFLQIENLPADVLFGAPISGPNGVIGLVRDDHKIVDARIAEGFAVREFKNSRRAAGVPEDLLR